MFYQRQAIAILQYYVYSHHAVFITRLEFDMLERDLHFWQNKTLALLTKYALNDQGMFILTVDIWLYVHEQWIKHAYNKYIYSQLLYVGHIHVENQCSLQQDVQHLQEQHDVLTQKLDNLITKLDNHSMLYNNWSDI